MKIRLNQHLCNAETYSLFHINLSPLSVDARWLALPRNHWGFPTKNTFYQLFSGKFGSTHSFSKAFYLQLSCGSVFAMGIQFHLDAST